jgi:hypothetical protein
MDENLLTVAALRTTAEADLIRGKLVAAGIAAVLVEPEQASEGAVAGRVQVQVHQPDFERAMQLLFPIPKLKSAAKPTLPSWRCPKCGEQVMGQFPACWSCGTTREGAPGGPTQPVLPATGVAPLVGLPRIPPPPTPADETAPPLESPPRITMPVAPSVPAFYPPPMPTSAGPTVNRPAMNGDTATKAAPLPPIRIPRTAEDDNLMIVVPAWDAAGGASAGKSRGRKSNPTEADDRAARRAWWTAVIGVVCPPLLIYSICVLLILGLTNRPLSARGSRFFYGALTVNALIIAAFFALLGTQQ